MLIRRVECQTPFIAPATSSPTSSNTLGSSKWAGFTVVMKLLAACVLDTRKTGRHIWARRECGSPYSGRALGNLVWKSSTPTHSGVIVTRTIDETIFPIRATQACPCSRPK